MTEYLILGALFSPLVVMLLRDQWQYGIIYTIVVGFFQDPIRKLVSGQPPSYSALVIIAFLLACLPLFLNKRSFGLFKPLSGSPRLVKVLNLSLLLLVIQSVHSYLRFSSLPLLALGLIFYLAPLISLWAGFNLGLYPDKVLLWLKCYIVLVLIFTTSVFLDFSGWQSPLLQEVGGGIRINLNQAGVMIEGFSGFWRTSEIASWHMVSGLCLLVAVAAATRRSSLIALSIIASIVVLLLVTLTGRRKGLALAAGFSILFPLVVQFTMSRGKNYSLLRGMIVAAAAIFIIAFIGVNLFDFRDWLGPIGSGFLARASTTASDALGRVQILGIGSLGWAFARGGFIGLGVGAGAQGSQYLNSTSVSMAVGGVAEAGSGKLLVELGIPGLLLVLAFAYLLVKYFFDICRFVVARDSGYGILMCALVSFMLANIPAFLVASQLYGDPFVLLVLGVLSGVILASPYVVGEKCMLTRPLAHGSK